MVERNTLYQKAGKNANWWRRWRWVLAAVLGVLVAAGLLAVLSVGRTSYATVQRGTIQGVVVATGEVVSAREVELSSQVSGQVTAVPVEVGQQVVTGTLLVSLESKSLAFRVEEARLRVEMARLQLEQAQEGAAPEEVAMAQADLEIARARLEALEAGPRSQEITQAQQEVVQAEAVLEQTEQETAVAVETARLNWEIAANALRDAQDAYSRIYWDNERLRQRGFELSQAQKDAENAAWRRVEDAEAAMEQARLAYTEARKRQETLTRAARARLAEARAQLQALLAGPTSWELAQARAQVARAEAALALLERGARPGEVEILRRELALAELALAQAEADLEKATVEAPFAGTVLELPVRVGQLVSLYAPLVRLADLTHLQVRARIDEIDVGQVVPGQPVTITLDAYPGRPLAGVVAEIAPAVTEERGSTYYLATVEFSEAPTLTLRLGMAASLSIVTERRENALLVPRRAVERIGSSDYVTVLRGRRRERVRVTLGLGDDRHYAVLSGLREGDRVLLP